jgi:hypothetical protein
LGGDEAPEQGVPEAEQSPEDLALRRADPLAVLGRPSDEVA